VRTEAKDLIEHGPASRRSSPSGFERFFRDNYSAVVHIAEGVVGDTHAAQDVAQDVFIAAERRFPESENSAHAAAWVKIAATHVALNTLRADRRRDVRQARFGATLAVPGPEERLIERESQQCVRHALARLPRRSATVLVLRYSGLSYGEVSEAMGIGIGQVGTMLRRAEAALRKEIERATRF